MRWLSALGSSMFATAYWSSSGRYGTASTMRENVSWTLRLSAVSSGVSVTVSGSSVISAARYGVSCVKSLEPDALGALDEDPQRPVGDLEHAGDRADHADAVEVVRPGLLELRVLRGDHDQHAVAGQHVVDELDGALLADRQRRERVRQRHALAQRQDRQHARHGALRADLDLAALAAAGDLDHGCSSTSSPRATSIGTLRERTSGRASGNSMRRMPSVYVARAWSGIDLGAERDHAAERAEVDLELLVEAALGVVGAAMAGDDELAALDLERQLVGIDAGQLGLHDGARGVALVEDVHGRREAAALGGREAGAVEDVAEELVHLAAHALEVREQVALGRHEPHCSPGDASDKRRRTRSDRVDGALVGDEDRPAEGRLGLLARPQLVELVGDVGDDEARRRGRARRARRPRPA